MSIARGFDYYTGTVYETRLLEFPTIGSICSGGRYDNLAGAFINRKLPGVGISLGLTRLFGKLVAEKRLRERGLNVEMYPTPTKIAQQMRYASRKGISYAWFPPFEEGGVHEVKHMASEKQVVADPAAWSPT